MTNWEINAHKVEDIFGGYVDWDERFYECPDCGEPIYECDWSDEDLVFELCPICEFLDEDLCDEPYDLEMGFDPYMGDYSFDC